MVGDAHGQAGAMLAVTMQQSSRRIDDEFGTGLA
jgi:hypothetical protein